MDIISITQFGSTILIVSLILYYFYVKYRLYYWTFRGVAQLENTKFIFGDTDFSQWIAIQYLNHYRYFQQNGEKFGGVYAGLTPIFIPVDIDLLKHILVKDFDHFMNHLTSDIRENEVLSKHMFNMKGEAWKSMRTRLTPTFTSGKMKMMFNTFLKCTNNLEKIIEKYVEKKKPIDTKEIVSRFNIDIIGNCAFGIDCDTLNNPDTEFRKYCMLINSVTPNQRILHFVAKFMPKSLIRLFRIQFMRKDVEKFFLDLVKSIVEYREKNNIKHNDFMHLMLQLKNRGDVYDDGNITDDDKAKALGNNLTINEIAAQCFVFFMAGFETSSLTTTFALYELALHQNIQHKVRDEINNVLNKYEKKLTYDGVQDMKYLDCVIKETLRLHPPFGLLFRQCNKDYKIPKTNIIIEKSTPIAIPILAVHMDKEFYHDPKHFNPDRFVEDNKLERPSCSFIPFGEGPRVCIGSRFGMLQTKVGLITFLRNHQVSVNENTELPVEIKPSGFIAGIKTPIYLDIRNA